MKQLSNDLRKQKENSNYDVQASFNRWVEEYAYVHDMSIEDTCNLAMFKSENLNYTGTITGKFEY